jgi:hypothetical protein
MQEKILKLAVLANINNKDLILLYQIQSLFTKTLYLKAVSTIARALHLMNNTT